MSETAEAQAEADDAEDEHQDRDERIAALEQQTSEAVSTANRALDRVLDIRQDKREIEAELEEAQQERDELRDEVDQLRERTDLLETVRRAAGSSVEERAAVCIQTLYNEAYGRGNRDTKDGATAQMDWNKAEGALGGGVSRDQIYRTFDRAEEIVGNDDLLEYIEEDRSSPKNTRLVLDLNEGELPESVGGHAIDNPEEVR